MGRVGDWVERDIVALDNASFLVVSGRGRVGDWVEREIVALDNASFLVVSGR